MVSFLFSTYFPFPIFPFLLLLPIFWVFHKYNHSSLPPGPRPWPIIGNLPHIGTKPHVALAHLAQTYGPLISLRLGSQLLVVGSSPVAAMQILKVHDRELCGRHVPHVSYAKSPYLNYVSIGWTYECSEQWNFLRTICKAKLFATKVVDNQSQLREKKMIELLQFLSSKQSNMVKIGQIVFVSVFNFLGNIFFSRDLMTFEEAGKSSGMNGLIRELTELWATPNISDLYPVLGGLDLQGLKRKSNNCVRNICGTWAGIIKERRENKLRDHNDFLDVLLDNEFNDDQINYIFVELFAAGTDTTTSTVEWAMAELIKNDKALKLLREELDREISKNVINEADLPRLYYLQACVKETLRLHPPAPLLLPRCALEKCKVMNFTIPKGTQVLVNIWAIGRDPNVWEEPLSFKPERFLDFPKDFKGNDFELLNFGGGRRICPGLTLGLRQVHLTLANLIYHFDWSLSSDMHPDQLDMNEKFGVTLQREQPLTVSLKQRKQGDMFEAV